MNTAGALSIGDVLQHLREEFPDITISKIRFLESQGLIDPERTVSGYRKFYPGDIERLRWILRQQKEHFLPLRVIKERLAQIDREGGPLPTDGGEAPKAEARPAKEAGDSPQRGDAEDPARTPQSQTVLFEASHRKRPKAGGRAAKTAPEPPAEVVAAPSGASFTRPELARAAELGDDELAALEEFGLVNPAYVSRDRVLFDEDALAVAVVAAGFLRHGLEPRHLRMYRGFAEREAALFEQVLLPYRRQRNPEAQARGEAVLGELADLGRRLRGALLRQAVRRALGS